MYRHFIDAAEAARLHSLGDPTHLEDAGKRGGEKETGVSEKS